MAALPPDHPIREIVLSAPSLFPRLAELVADDDPLPFPLSSRLSHEILILRKSAETITTSIAKQKLIRKWLEEVSALHASALVPAGEGVGAQVLAALTQPENAEGLRTAIGMGAIDRKLEDMGAKLDKMGVWVELEQKRRLNRDLVASGEPVIPVVLDGKAVPEECGPPFTTIAEVMSMEERRVNA